MSLDINPMRISDALRIAKKHYDDKTYSHALRVAGYIAENETINPEYRDECICLGVMHDLLEDTEFSAVGLPENFYKALKLLSKPEDMPYDDYCKMIQETGYTNWRMCAYWVKLADMKDHLNLTDTLTDKLKEKYLSGLRHLL